MQQGDTDDGAAKPPKSADALLGIVSSQRDRFRARCLPPMYMIAGIAMVRHVRANIGRSCQVLNDWAPVILCQATSRVMDRSQKVCCATTCFRVQCQTACSEQQ